MRHDLFVLIRRLLFLEESILAIRSLEKDETRQVFRKIYAEEVSARD